MFCDSAGLKLVAFKYSSFIASDKALLLLAGTMKLSCTGSVGMFKLVRVLSTPLAMRLS